MADVKVGDPRPDGYLAFHEWANIQHKGGLRQQQCSTCGLWFFPQEQHSHGGAPRVRPSAHAW